MKTPEQVDAELDEIERRWKMMKSNAADFARLIIVTVVAIVISGVFLLVIPGTMTALIGMAWAAGAIQSALRSKQE